MSTAQNFKFATRNFAGQPVKCFTVARDVLPAAAATQVRPVTHHCIVADRSGSMYYDIEALKATILKVLTLDEYRDANLLVSLITYSSQGDVTTHFSRVKVADIMVDGSRYQQAIKGIRVTGLTCISQALRAAEALVRAGTEEVQCISLHSDGFANDNSPAAEQREIAKICTDLAGIPGVFVNTIAYNQYSDYKLLSGIANQLSGRCVQAVNIKGVYDALYDTTALLAGQMAPAVTVTRDGADYVVFLSRAAGRVNGGTADLTVKGVKATDDKAVYRYREITAAEYVASSLPDADYAGIEGVYAVLGYARAQLADGRLNAAKFAMVTTRIPTALIGRHARAITTPQIADMARDLEAQLFATPADQVLHQQDPVSGYGLGGGTSVSLLGLTRILNAHKADVRVNLPALFSNYRRRTLKRVAGTRDEAGVLKEPEFETRYTDVGDYAAFGGFEINNTSANINMMVIRPISLVQKSDGAVIGTVEGIQTDALKDFKQYTVVGDGTLNLRSLQFRCSSKKLYTALTEAGLVAGGFDPNQDIVLDLAGLPMVDYDAKFGALDATYEKVLGYKILGGLFSALLKGQSETYTPEQLEALRRHNLSSSLYVNFPTTNAYTDLQAALACGEVDSRISYRVEIGNADIVNAGKLMSANKFLERTYEIAGGADPKKPTMLDFWAAGFKVSLKKQSDKLKLTRVDALMRPFFDDFLGLACQGLVAGALMDAGASDDLINEIDQVGRRQLTGDRAVEAVTRARGLVAAAADDLYEQQISPLVFYVGATGLVPDEYGDLVALTAEQLAAQIPGVSLAKAEQDGTFYRIGATLLGIYAKSEYFTVEKPKTQTTAPYGAVTLPWW